MTTLRLGRPIRVGEIEVIPIERMHGTVDTIGGGILAIARKEPAALVIRTPDGDRAADLDGAEVALDELLRDVPGLREWLR